MSLAQALAENARIQALAREGTPFQRRREDEEFARAQAANEPAAANKTFRSLFEARLINDVNRRDGTDEALFPPAGRVAACRAA